MMSMSEPDRCVYCGTAGNLTREHAPPKLLFPKPWPSNFITVPACEPCNQAGMKNAEYLRACLCLKPGKLPGENLATTKDAVRRSLERPQGEGFRNSILRAMEPAGNKIAFTVEIQRLHVVVERIVQCLYLHETGKRLDLETHEVSALCDDYLNQFDEGEQRQFHENFVIPLSQLDPTIIGDDVFAYASIHTPKAFVSVWGLLFYGSVPFIALTGPRKRPLRGELKPGCDGR